ncbi:leucine-rich repeat protein, partial [Clostridium beijerinckii]
IGIKAFCNCYDLEGITIPESVTSIGGGAFLMCDNLKSITLPSNLTSIEPSTFVGCDKLTSINLPKNLKSIGNGAFAECNSLDNITIPEGTKSIDKFAFDNCTLLKSVFIPNSVTYIGENAFDGCNDAIFYVNSGEQKQRLIDSGVNGSKIVVANQPQKLQVTNISLSLNNLDCVIGDKKTLTETVTPSGATDQTVTWSSSNNNVVAVDQNGNINAVGAGSATITCTANDGSGISATCAVTVIGQSSTGSTGGNSGIGNTGGTGNTGGNGSSGNTGGTGNTGGNSSSGNTGSTGNTGGNSGIINLTNVKVAGITIGGNSSIGAKGGTLILTPNITPSNATNKNVTWTSNNPSVATVNAQGVVTAIANGTAAIIATATDGSGITVNTLITVTGQTASSTGSDSILESVSISGTEEVSHRLKANVRYTGTEPSLDYKWQRADTRDGEYTDISGADEKEYRLKSSDRNKYIKVIVTATINGT